MEARDFSRVRLHCCKREGEELDYEDIEDAAECLINGIPYAGLGEY
ncbi:hypothetical protein [Butyrivibrio fibrisolvens]|nr:hypothetical protein [Butyrivibrio fibrisolvens]